MEIEFSFSCGSKNKKVKVTEDQNIYNTLNSLISKYSYLKKLNISILLSKGNIFEKTDTFKDKKISNNDIICVICDEKIQEVKQEKTEPIKFQPIKKLINHAHVNLEDEDINAFIDRTFDVFESLTGQYFLICAYSEDYNI